MDTKRIVVKCEIPFLIRTDDPETEDFAHFSVPTQDYTAELGFRMAPGGGKGNITTAGGSDEDRLGHMATTHVKTELDEEFVDNIPDEISDLPDSLQFQMGSGGSGEASYIVEEVTKCINKFLEIYKVNTESYWMRRLLPHDIFDFVIVKIDNQGEKKEQHHKHTAGAMTGMGSTLSENDISEIQDSLSKSENPSIYSRIQLEIRDQISLKEYDIAVVSSQRLMESWLKQSFEHLLKTVEGYSQSKAEDTARHQDGSFKDFHDIRKMYDSKLDFDLEATSEFQQWQNNSKDVRNDIIHEGYEPTKQEAVNSVQTNNSVIMRVKSEFKSDLSDDLVAVSKMPSDGVGRTTLSGS